MKSLLGAIWAIIIMMMLNWTALLVYLVLLPVYFFIPLVKIALISFIMQHPHLALFSILVSTIMAVTAVFTFFVTGGNIESLNANSAPIGTILYGSTVIFNVTLLYIVLTVRLFVPHVSVVIH